VLAKEFIEGCEFHGCDSFCCEWFCAWHVLLEDGIVILKHVGVEVTLMSHIYCKCIYLVHEMKVLIQNEWSK